ncbi:MAG: hypothetical protein JXM75_04205 [Chromatiaceae bacterium]|nr:hypothetical protein [Chromatiaceae bacterium]
MIDPIQDLPPAPDLNIGALSALFRYTTNSYKFVFFLALLDLLKRHRFDAERPYTYDELIVEMLVIAWYPHTFFKLSFGVADQLANKLDALELESGESERLLTPGRSALRERIRTSDLRHAASLMNFVPYRLVRPFIEPWLKDVDTGTWSFESACPSIVNAHFETDRLLYRFDSDTTRQCRAVIVHPAWAAYLERHIAIIEGWTAWHWLHYMQRRNPTTPALANKLFPPAKREALTRQTKYWRGILEATDPPLTCIYSGEPLTAASFALDHYLPWSFVAHDQLWNLIPTPRDVNSAKSNRLPSSDYFQGFVTLQHRGLLIARQTLGEARFGKAVEGYLADLHLPSLDALLDIDQLRTAYERSISPLLTLAQPTKAKVATICFSF